MKIKIKTWFKKLFNKKLTVINDEVETKQVVDRLKYLVNYKPDKIDIDNIDGINFTKVDPTPVINEINLYEYDLDGLTELTKKKIVNLILEDNFVRSESKLISPVINLNK
jgi:hypothetical protein